MIAYIKGKVIKKSLNSIIIATNGIGYEVFIPLNNLARIFQGDELELYTYLHIREDLMQLYGFFDWAEREVFLLLINVSGVGPKAALAILSHISVKQLQVAIASGDIQLLTKLPGIGKKTAQRLVVELKDKMQGSLSDGEDVTEDFITDNEIIAALTSLGYQVAEVKKIIPQLLKENPDADETTLIKKGLQILAKI
ncbi:MAG: holliday junction helicase RuvA [Clostridia bacterium]|jgi:Holliday junction DNA helicase RuvA|nr:holliday junction helicase RuvA [Clostridia bacterium]MDN5323899.1 holliday junction helicase RuvA [Clostridia bacterium]